jgi:hypothetical protein
MVVIVFAIDLINLAVLLSAGMSKSSWIASGRMESFPYRTLDQTGAASHPRPRIYHQFYNKKIMASRKLVQAESAISTSEKRTI